MNKNATLYVSDLDGTLLGSDSRLSHNAISTLNDLIAHGAMFTVATARTPATVTPLLEQLNINLPAIVLTGAATWSCKHKKYLSVNALSHNATASILSVFKQHAVNPFVYCRNGNVINARHISSLSTVEQQFVNERTGLELKRFSLGDNIFPLPHEDVLIVFAIGDYDRLFPLVEQLKHTTPCSPGIYHDIFNPTVGVVEVYAPLCTKAIAVKHLANSLGATRIVAFGDNTSDIPMLQAATCGVAVSNAFSDVKEAATTVIGSNDNDAVPEFIKNDFYNI